MNRYDFGGYPPGCVPPADEAADFLDDFRVALDVGAKSAARKTARFDGFVLGDLDIEFIPQTDGRIRCVISHQCSVTLDREDVEDVDEGLSRLGGTLAHFWSTVE